MLSWTLKPKQMNKTLIAISIFGVACLSVGCSSLTRLNQKTVDTGDAPPLFPVTTVNIDGNRDVSLEGRWYIRTVGMTKLADIEDADWPFVEFVPAEARFYGTNGCNVINGSYRTGADRSLSLSNIATSLRFCPDDSLGYLIDDAMTSTTAYSTSLSPDGSTVLSLYNQNKFAVMTLRKSDIDFLSGPWQVVGINGEECTAPDARLVFDIPGSRISGNAGCNRLNGELTRDPNVSASVQFSNLATTRMTCPDIQSESALLIALEMVHSVRHKENRAELLSSSGNVVVELERLSKQDLQNSDEEQ